MFAWAKSISRELYRLDEKPLLGAAPRQFPWDKLSADLQRVFGLDDIGIEAGTLEWLEAANLLKGLPEPFVVEHIQSAGLEGECAVVFSERDIDTIMGLILQADPSAVQLVPHDFAESFFDFLTIETLHLISKYDFSKNFSFKMTPHNELTEQAALCQDIWITISQHRMLARLIITPAFRSSWSAAIAAQDAPLPSDALQVVVHVEAGRVTLSQEELSSLQPGDCLCIENAFYNPAVNKNECMLTVCGQPLVRAQIQGSSLKILQIPVHHEVLHGK